MLKNCLAKLQLDVYFCRLQFRMTFLKKDISKAVLPTSINDLNDRYYDGEQMSQDELRAIKNYNLARIDYLNAAEDEADFEKRYLLMQAKANLADYREFL